MRCAYCVSGAASRDIFYWIPAFAGMTPHQITAVAYFVRGKQPFDRLRARKEKEDEEGAKLQRCKGAKLQRYKGAKLQRYKGTKLQRCKGTKLQRYKGTKLQRYKVTKLQSYKGTKLQRYKGTKLQRYKGTKLQSYKGTKLQSVNLSPGQFESRSGRCGNSGYRSSGSIPGSRTHRSSNCRRGEHD